MGFVFKVYYNSGKEYFRWKSDSTFTNTKGEKQKDFELSQSLLDLLDLEIGDDYFKLCDRIGSEIQHLYEPNMEHNISFIRGSFDELAKRHIFFEFLRLDWYERIDRFEIGKCTKPREEMYYKDITHIPMNILTWQSELKTIFSQALDVMSPDKSVQEKMSALYSRKYGRSLPLFHFQSVATVFERVDATTFAEVLHPKTIGEMIDFLLRTIIQQELTFKVCRSCGKYFPATLSHGNSEYCNRLFKDTGKTCKEIGSVKVYQAKLEENPEYKAYNRAY
ncbi:MAG: hypothetical protein GX800_11290 [Clostridiaceae bacterium]|nr:hypothetical protein [Clostridiaceae bacterium]